ncbi:MAG: hypothetical protein GY722_17545 [bacterium]|nr:hypothetical protein [bacterium]
MKLESSLAVALALLSWSVSGAASTITGTNWYQVDPAPIANAQTYPTPDRIDATGRPSVIVNLDSPNDVYIGNATGGVWRSEDGGQSWKPLAELR